MLIDLARRRLAAGDAATATEHLDGAEGLAGDVEARGEVDLVRSEVAAHQGDLDRALSLAGQVAESGAGALAARAHLQLGRLHRSVGRAERAREHFERAASGLARAGDDRALASAMSNLGILSLSRGRPGAAHRALARSLSLFRSIGDERGVGLVLGNLAIAAQESGAFEEARERFDEAIDLLRAIGEEVAAGGFVGYRGTLSHERGELEAARADYEAAIAALAGGGEDRLAALFGGCLAAVRATSGELDRARDAFDRAESTLRALGVEVGLTALGIHRGHLDLALERAEAARGDAAAAAEHRSAARMRLASFDSTSAAPPPEEVRFAVRTLEVALAAPPPAVATDPEALVLADDGAWFQPPGGRRVEVAHRPALRRVLAELARARVDTPGATVSSPALVGAGWPGEPLSTPTAKNRLRVTVATLRGLGLATLLTRDGGYLLDPDVPVTLMPGADLADS